MQNRPSMSELLEAVEEFLREDAMKGLAGRSGFHARVAANVVGIVRRELANSGEDLAEERRGLLALLGKPRDTGEDLSELNVELCRRIRTGELGLEDPRLVEHLRRTTLAKLAVDNPRYAGYRRHLD